MELSTADIEYIKAQFKQLNTHGRIEFVVKYSQISTSHTTITSQPPKAKEGIRNKA